MEQRLGSDSAAGEATVALLRRACQGDGGAFSELARPLYPRLLSVARRIVTDGADAEEVVQEALWSAFQGIAGYRDRCAFATWLVRITMNASIDLLRRRRASPAFIYEPDFSRRRARDRTPEEIYLQNEAARLLADSIARVPAPHRAALVLRVVDELSHEEIARALGLSVSNVKTRIHRGCRELRQVLVRRLAWRSETLSIARCSGSTQRRAQLDVPVAA